MDALADQYRSPYLLPDAEPEPYFVGEHVVASSSKIVAIDKILADILPKGERVLIFSVCLLSSCYQSVTNYVVFRFSNGLGKSNRNFAITTRV